MEVERKERVASEEREENCSAVAAVRPCKCVNYWEGRQVGRSLREDMRLVNTEGRMEDGQGRTVECKARQILKLWGTIHK